MTAATHVAPAGTTTETHGSISTIAEEWDALASELNATPFARPGWFEAWSNTFGSDQLEIICVRRDGRLVGVLPLHENKGHRKSLTNFHSPRFEPLATDAAAASTVAAAALGSRRLSLSFVESDSPAMAEIARAALGAGYSVDWRAAEQSPEVAVTGTWEQYLTTISKNMRREFKRRNKRLAKLGEVEFETHVCPDDIEARVREAFAVEATSWKGDAGTAVAVAGDQLDFYVDVARWAARRGWTRICLLRVDGRAIASDFALELNGIFYSLKGGYDPEFAEYSPGRLMDGLEIQRAHELGLSRFEFGGDAEHHKMQWRPQFRPLIRFDAFAPTLTGRAEQALVQHGREPVKKLRTLVARHQRRASS